MTHPDDRASERDATEPSTPAAPAAESPLHGHDVQPPHPPFARTSDEYTDPPGHHRRGPNGPALDVGA